MFTPAALDATAPTVRQALLAQGTPIAALNISLPNLERAVGWQGFGGPNSWLSASERHPIFSIVRQSSERGGSSESSDFLHSVNAFVAFLRAKETRGR